MSRRIRWCGSSPKPDPGNGPEGVALAATFRRGVIVSCVSSCAASLGISMAACETRQPDLSEAADSPCDVPGSIRFEYKGASPVAGRSRARWGSHSDLRAGTERMTSDESLVAVKQTCWLIPRVEVGGAPTGWERLLRTPQQLPSRRAHDPSR